MTALIVLSSTTAQTRILPRTGAKPLIITGMTLGLVAMLLLTRLSPSSSYAGGVLPSLLILGLGMGTIFAPAFGTATLGVERNEAGVASAMVNTSQQVGGSVGTSLLSTLFASSAAAYARSHRGIRAPPGRGAGPRLHDRVLVGGRHLRRRSAHRAHSLPGADQG